MNIISNIQLLSILKQNFIKRSIHVTAVNHKSQSGRYKPKPGQTLHLTYEMANPPHYIGHQKSWNSWNTSNLLGGNRPAETAIEDMFIRKFMVGTWPSLIGSEVIIKRQFNMIRIAVVIIRNISPIKMYFLLGYTEELLSYWLQCPVKLELVTTPEFKDVIYTTVSRKSTH